MNRKPIFDAVRTLLKRGFTQAEVDALDLACDLAEASVSDGKPPRPRAPQTPTAVPASTTVRMLGQLSEEFESGGRGPGTVSTGVGDAGGVSYGVYQLSSVTGTCAVFMKSEGKPWSERFGSHRPGEKGFSDVWRAVGKDDADAFRKAQHAFIERTHYRPVIDAVLARKGLDLNSRHDAVRDATWSCSVQHGKAAIILIDAIDNVDRTTDRNSAAYDRELIEAIYRVRTAFVLAVANNPKQPQAVRDQLISITRNRYPKELKEALLMLDATPASASASVVPKPLAADGSVDGNAIAAANGVAVKSAAVKIRRLHPSMEPVIVEVARAARKLGLPQPVITSGNDSRHMAGSLHFQNRALDFRGNNVKVSVGRSLEAEVGAQLGDDYDVIFEVFENPVNNHLHVEFDPK